MTFVTVSRWESGQAKPNPLGTRALVALAATARGSPQKEDLSVREGSASYRTASRGSDFLSPGEDVRLFVEAERLSYGHLFSPVFGTETALIDPLPHQLLAVYRHMLTQARLRFLLADDAGAGKTIMTGLYIREMLSRRLIRRVLVVPPAGLVGNWKRELRTLFSLEFREVTGPDCRLENPFAGSGSDLALVSVDTLATGRALERLCEPETVPYDLVVFDEAHKLGAARNNDLSFETTDRYKLAELLAGADALQESHPSQYLAWQARHLLLLTATPHMGKDFPYYALWRLLDPVALPTLDAFNSYPREERAHHFLRRTKEEMVRFDRSRIYPTRQSDTASFELTPAEWELYEQTTAYIRTYYNRAQVLNRSAARLAMSVIQRRAASSTWALIRSLERRLGKLDGYLEQFAAKELTEAQLRSQQQRLRVADVEETKTSDEESAEDGAEERDTREDEAMGATTASTVAELQVERMQVEDLLLLARAVYTGTQEESKFERLREIIQNPRFRNEKLLVFTEHRDTMDFLARKLEGMGFTGQVARIHGGMPYQERESQVENFRGPHCRFMVATDAAGEGINLQFCWIMVNYDIPWNPARIEQRFGRIHRYKQVHDPVVLVNLVAAKTRDGRVLSTLLQKMELIRRELRSDKVFDVIGRQFLGVSLTDIIMRAVVDDVAEQEAARLGGSLTADQVQALVDTDRKLSEGGDVLSQLDGLIRQDEVDRLHRLLPGYVSRFMEKSALRLGITLAGDLDGEFQLRGLPPALAMTLDAATEGQSMPLMARRPGPDQKALFLRPGELFFDRYRSYFAELTADAAQRGGVFVDPDATAPYFYHLARITVVRRADHDSDAYREDQTVDSRLVAVRQAFGEEPEPCPVELLMVLRAQDQVRPEMLPSHTSQEEALLLAKTYLRNTVAESIAQAYRDGLLHSLPEREAFLRKGFDFQEAELLEARAKLRDKAQSGDAAARRRLDDVRQQQRVLRERMDRILRSLRQEPELVEAAEVTLLAHALVVPSTDPDDRQQYDKEIELIAMRVVQSYEEAMGATVADVSTPLKAAEAGLERWPGFDLLSRRADGTQRCIEVKGRRAVGDVELKENEWAKAANLRGDYWLYVVYDCAAAHPRLLRVADPFASLLFKIKSDVIIDEASVFGAAEDEAYK